MPRLRELGGRGVGVPDRCGLRGRQITQPGVVRRIIDDRRAVELRTGRLRREVVVAERGVVADAVRPAEIPRLGDPGVLDRAFRPAVGDRSPGVRAVVGDHQRAAHRIRGDPERVAHPHRIDLRTGPLRTGCEEIALGDGVRAVVLRGDAQDLATQIVRIARRALGVPGAAALTLVDRAESVRGERVGVVTRRRVQIPVLVEGERTGHMGVGPALAAPGRNGQQSLLRGGVDRVAGGREAGEVEPLLGLVGMQQIEPVVRGEARIERETEQPVGLAGHLGRVREVQRGRDLHGLLVDDLELSGALGEEHPAVRCDRQLERVGEVAGGQCRALEGTGPSRGAVTRLGTRGPLDAAQQMLDEALLLEGRRGMAMRR